MNKLEKLFESKKILIGLVVLFFIVSIVQGIFLVRLYHSFDQDVSNNTIKKFENNLGFDEDTFKRFDQQSWHPFENHTASSPSRRIGHENRVQGWSADYSFA